MEKPLQRPRTSPEPNANATLAQTLSKEKEIEEAINLYPRV
jgi:hypothetical protein